MKTKLIVVWSAKGGVSKTTISLHLCDFFTRKEKRVLFYDTDEQRSGYSIVTESNDMPFDVVCSLDDVNVSEYDYVIVDTPPRLKLLSKEHRTLIKNADVIVTPVNPARIDFESLESMEPLLKNKKVVKVLSRFDARSKDDKLVKKNKAADFMIMSQLTVYKSTINECYSVFSKQSNGKSSISSARREMKLIANQVEFLLSEVAK